MKGDPDIDRYFSGSVYRVLSALFGLFLVVLGVYVVFFGVVSLHIRIGAGLLITLFGPEAIWSSIQSRQSWLAKLGPFF